MDVFGAKAFREYFEKEKKEEEKKRAALLVHAYSKDIEMTIEDAIDTIERNSCNECSWGCESAITCEGNCELTEASIVVVKAAVKQIRKKPADCHHCPSCGIGIPIPPMASKEFKPFAKFPKYCDECGQALDWSDYD